MWYLQLSRCLSAYDPIYFSECVLSSYYLPAPELGINQAAALPALSGFGARGLLSHRLPTGAACPMDAETGLCCSWEVS